LFGNVTVENLEEEHSTRNARLMRMMEDLHIVENRGSGIKTMLQAMRAANLEPPRFNDRRSSFLVTFRNHTLMNPEAITWLVAESVCQLAVERSPTTHLGLPTAT
jgi:ATP-dependent DNA helicase RecG